MPVHGFEFLELGEIHRGADHGPVDDGRQEATDFQSSEDGIRLAGQSLDELDHDIARAMEFVSSYQQGHNLVGFEDSEEMRVRGGGGRPTHSKSWRRMKFSQASMTWLT